MQEGLHWSYDVGITITVEEYMAGPHILDAPLDSVIRAGQLHSNSSIPYRLSVFFFSELLPLLHCLPMRIYLLSTFEQGQLNQQQLKQSRQGSCSSTNMLHLLQHLQPAQQQQQHAALNL